jgi:outer membrane protein OmpA-like peptidoglycan-associated protein/Tol biopolymer transport system component
MRTSITPILVLSLILGLSLPAWLFAQDGRKVENLGPNINSQYNEALPIISADGKTLFFVRENSPQNVDYVEGTKNQNIWFSTLQEDGTWSPAQNMTSLNSGGRSFVSSVTPDGNILLLGRRLVRRTRTGWSAPEEVVIHGFHNRHKQNLVNFFLANDGQVMIISTQMDDSKGFLDLYVSFLQDDGTWSKPMNLGNTVNSFGDDFSPFLAADGKTLYFASNGITKSDDPQKTLGGSDIYVTRRLDDSWRNWSKPENLGPSINTTGNDQYFVIPACGDWSYMVASEASLGGYDIYRLPIPAGMKPNPVMLLNGTVTDASTGAELTAKVIYKVKGQAKNAGIASTNPATGDYTVVLPVGQAYTIIVSVPNYVSDTLQVDLTNQTVCVTKKETHKLNAQPTVIRGKVTNAITQAPVTATLRYKAKPGETQLQARTTASGEYRIEVPGTTESVEFELVATGFNLVNENLNIAADQRHGEVTKNFGLRPSAIVITGRVLDKATNQPVGKAKFAYKLLPSGGETNLETDANSNFRIEVPGEAGQYELMAEAYGFYMGKASISIDPSKPEFTTDVLLTARPPLMIRGMTYNDKTKDPLPGVRLFTEKLATRQRLPDLNESGGDGKYRIDLQEVTDYLVIAKKDMHITVYEKVQLESQEKFQEIERNLYLLPIEIGTTVRLNNILFETAKATLKSESFEELDRLVSLLEDASRLVIEIAGHTDDVGKDDYNLDLSNKRANAVRDYLLEKGVAPDRIVAKGYGETQFLVKNDSEANRAINRRVEFRVLKIN